MVWIKELTAETVLFGESAGEFSLLVLGATRATLRSAWGAHVMLGIKLSAFCMPGMCL